MVNRTPDTPYCTTSAYKTVAAAINQHLNSDWSLETENR